MWSGTDDVTEINDICAYMYESSARCDKHYRAYSSQTKQAKYAEAVAQEDLTCDFIDSVVMGNFNEMGFVNLGSTYSVDGQTGWMSDSALGQSISAVSPLQIFGLVASIMAVVILATWSMTLHQSLTKGGPWRPRRGLRGETSDSNALSRQNSGIVLGRSMSNTSYYVS